MTKPKNEEEKKDINFEKEDVILNKIQENLLKIKDTALNAPDFLEQIKKQEQDKKVAVSDSLNTSI